MVRRVARVGSCLTLKSSAFGWANADQTIGEAPVSDGELREALRAGDNAFRHRILWQLKAWTPGEGGEWRGDALRLLREVWPRELVVRSPSLSEDLFELALAMTFQRSSTRSSP